MFVTLAGGGKRIPTVHRVAPLAGACPPRFRNRLAPVGGSSLDFCVPAEEGARRCFRSFAAKPLARFWVRG